MPIGFIKFAVFSFESTVWHHMLLMDGCGRC